MRHTSTCCGCNFSFNITCPALKVPITPEIKCPEDGTVLGGQSFTQCGNPVWAYGDTLAAVNGIVTGADDSEDAACTHACCAICCSPRNQFDLSTCPEVYTNPGVYYHRIRYVTSSFEVSDFSEPGCFCVAQGLYEEACTCCDAPCNVCILDYNCSTICYCVRNDATNDVNQCILLESSFDSDFNTIIDTIECSGDCVSNNSKVCAEYSFNPRADGTYDPPGLVYTRVTTYGGFCCDFVSDPCVYESCIFGDLYVFALCDGVNNKDPNIEGCNCIQLFATYTHDCSYCCVSSLDISYKFDVSPFCTFDPGFTTTACGPFNVFIPKDTLAGGGSCPNYYVRACVESNTAAPPVVRCAILGNVTKPELTGNCCSSNPECYGGLCTGTINWNGEIAIYGIGSGGAGGSDFDGDCCCESRKSRDLFFAVSSNRSGSSGSAVLATTSSKCGCCYCLVAGNAPKGQWISRNLTSGNNSYVEIVGDNTYYALGARGCGDARDNSLPGSIRSEICWPFYGDLKITNTHGASGIVKPCADASTLSYHCSYTYYGNNQRFCDSDIYDASLMSCLDSAYGSRLMGICCCEDMTGFADCSAGPCNYDCTILPDSCINNCKCDGRSSGGNLGLNTFGVGGFGGVICKCGEICYEYAISCYVCAPTRGFGFGAGSPSDNFFDNWGYDNFYDVRNMMSGLNSSQYCCTCSGATDLRLYYGSCNGYGCMYDKTRVYLSNIGTGGAAGMIFLCNCFDLTHDSACEWCARMGYIVFACQDFE